MHELYAELSEYPSAVIKKSTNLIVFITCTLHVRTGKYEAYLFTTQSKIQWRGEPHGPKTNGNGGNWGKHSRKSQFIDPSPEKRMVVSGRECRKWEVFNSLEVPEKEVEIKKYETEQQKPDMSG